MLNFNAYSFQYYPRFLSVDLPVSREASPIVVKIYPLFYKQMVVEWSIPADWGNCTFNIFKGPGDAGPWTKISPVPVSGFYFKDVNTVQSSKYFSDFYKVEVQTSTGKVFQSIARTWENVRTGWVNLRATEIRRRELLLLSKFVGVPSIIFRRKTFGKRCPICWNGKIEKVIKDNCPSCLGTSFEGGYFEGFKTLLQYDPTPNETQFSYQGRFEPNTIMGWTVDTPDVSPFDLVLRLPDWKIYRVEAIQNTELQAVKVRQILKLNELDKESIEFRLANSQMPTDYQNE